MLINPLHKSLNSCSRSSATKSALSVVTCKNGRLVSASTSIECDGWLYRLVLCVHAGHVMAAADGRRSLTAALVLPLLGGVAVVAGDQVHCANHGLDHVHLVTVEVCTVSGWHLHRLDALRCTVVVVLLLSSSLASSSLFFSLYCLQCLLPHWLPLFSSWCCFNSYLQSGCCLCL